MLSRLAALLRRWSAGRWALLGGLVWAASLIVWYRFGWDGKHADHYVAMFVKAPGVLVAAGLWYLAARHHLTHDGQRRAAKLIAWGLLAAGLSPLVWLGRLSVPLPGGSSPFANPALAVFLGLLIGVVVSARWLWLRVIREVPVLLDFATVMIAGLLVEWILVLDPVTRGLSGFHVDLIISPLVDLALLAGLAASWLSPHRTPIRLVWLAQLGQVGLIVGDTVWMRSQGQAGHLAFLVPIICWTGGALFSAAGALLAACRTECAALDSPEQPTYWRVLVPVVLTYVTLKALESTGPGSGLVVQRYGSAVVALLIIIRLAVSLDRSQKLYDQLQRSEARFRGLVQSSADAVVVMDAQGQVLFQSASVLPLMGIVPNHPANTALAQQRIHPEDIPHLQAVWKQVQSSPGQRQRTRFRILGEDGGWRSVVAVLNNLADDADIGGIVCNLRDVTEQEVVEERWRRLVETSPTVIYTLEAAFPFGITFVSQQITAVLGYTPEEIVVKPDEFWERVHEDDLPYVVASARLIPQSDAPFSADLRLRHKNGTYRWFHTSARRITDAGGQATGIVGTLVDLTVIKELTDEMRTANAELESRVAARTMALEKELEERVRAEEALRRSERERAAVQDRFLQIAAHELRNPLAGVMSMASLLRMAMAAGKPLERLDAMADSMEREVARLASLLEEVLDAFRTRDGQLPLKQTALNLSDVVGRALDPFTARAPHRFRFVFDPGTVFQVYGDAHRLEEVFRNLVGNAAKYSPADSEIVVRLYTALEGREHVVTVTDRGLGIPGDQLKSIFDGFVRGRNLKGRDPGGMGLGLYICREIIHQHDGRIWAESREGFGSTFYVALPACGERTGSSDGAHTDCGG